MNRIKKRTTYNIKFANGRYGWQMPQSLNKAREAAKKYNAAGMACKVVSF